MKKLLRKIFFRKLNYTSFVIAGLGYVLGFLILMIASNLYIKFTSSIQDDGNYMIINKKVKLGNMDAEKGGFSDEEIKELKAQPFVKNLGRFNSSRFQILVTMKQLGLKSDLSFESVPDDFVDCKLPVSWRRYRKGWDPDEETVPIVLSRDWFNIYNSSFAFSRNTPQFTEGAVKAAADLNFRFRGKNGEWNYKGKIVGYSDRIQSFLVPESFMIFANKKFEGLDPQSPSRVIIETDNSQSDGLQKFMKDKNYKINADDMNSQQSVSVLYKIVSIAGILGIAFVVLSITLVITLFTLIISDAKQEIQLLLQVGYSRSTISRFLGLYIFGFLAIITLLSFALFPVIAPFLYGSLESITADMNLMDLEWSVVAITLGCFGICFGACMMTLRSAIRKKL